ncbi:AAA family ATPase [Qipengyuania zhejiangensis]|uniref:AAA family ATPase n=1 Tax=Qipengyuania zhejiangensis TaxID=3077782 RepID=UPI002D7993A1|nr:AAA family ATPase [Qipengyuania sp. Z2]
MLRPVWREIADAVVSSHDRAMVAHGDGARRVLNLIEANHAGLGATKSRAMDARLNDELFRASCDRLPQLSSLLDRRSEEGFVRHCVGALEVAEDVVEESGGAMLDSFPAQSETQAPVDVLYDLALLLVHLWHIGLRNEASLVFNRYCDWRAEAAGLAALPLFLSIRAAQSAIVAAQWQRDGQAARNLLSLALAALERPAPRVIAIGGLSGSGKSTVAGNLAPGIGTVPGARWLRTDVLRKRLAGVKPEAHLPQSAYTTAAHNAAYAALYDLVAKTVQAGWPVIVDAVFDYEDTRLGIERLAASLDVPFTGLWLQAPRATLHARVLARKGDASDAGPDVVDRQMARCIGSLGSWNRVDASGSAEETLSRVLGLLEPC